MDMYATLYHHGCVSVKMHPHPHLFIGKQHVLQKHILMVHRLTLIQSISP